MLLQKWPKTTALACLGIGVIVGLAIDRVPYLILNPSIKVTELLSLFLSITTVSIALYIAVVLDRTKKKEEYKYKYIFNKFEAMQTASQSLELLVRQNEVTYSEVTSKLKVWSIMYDDLYATLTLCAGGTYAIDRSQELRADIKDIRRLCTENARYKPGTNIVAYSDKIELKISDSVITYSSIRTDQIVSALVSFMNDLFLLIIEEE